jgi:hypothetical protein
MLKTACSEALNKKGGVFIKKAKIAETLTGTELRKTMTSQLGLQDRGNIHFLA